MTGHDTRLLVVARGVASKLKDLSRQVLEDGSKVDRSASTNTLCVVALLQQTMNTPDWELHCERHAMQPSVMCTALTDKSEMIRTTSFRGTRLRLRFGISTSLARLAADFARFSLACHRLKSAES